MTGHVDVCTILQREVWEGRVTWGLVCLLFLEIWQTINTNKRILLRLLCEEWESQEIPAFKLLLRLHYNIASDHKMLFLLHEPSCRQHRSSSPQECIRAQEQRRPLSIYLPNPPQQEIQRGEVNKAREARLFPEQTGLHACFCHTAPIWLSWNLSTFLLLSFSVPNEDAGFWFARVLNIHSCCSWSQQELKSEHKAKYRKKNRAVGDREGALNHRRPWSQSQDSF